MDIYLCASNFHLRIIFNFGINLYFVTIYATQITKIKKGSCFCHSRETRAYKPDKLWEAD